MKHPLANYDKERELFLSLLDANCQKRILLFRGESGSGKTTLLRSCLQSLPRSVIHVPVEFKDKAVSVTEIFDRVGDHVGWLRFPNFTNEIAALRGLPLVQVERNWQTGSNNQINVALSAEHTFDREQRRVLLTKAWFDDLRMLSQMMLLVLDTFEQATTEVAQWISGPFLERAKEIKQLRILLAGQVVPDSNNIEWGSHCEVCELYGVLDAHDWLPVLHAMDRYVPGVHDLSSWLAGVCYARQGSPVEIMKIIESLPRQGVKHDR